MSVSDEKWQTAEQDLEAFLRPGEAVEAVVFGDFGYGDEHDAVSETKRGVPLSWDEARPMMQTWRFHGGFGGAECYKVTIYTPARVIFVSEYDGSTGLNAVPRNPVPHKPVFG